MTSDSYEHKDVRELQDLVHDAAAPRGERRKGPSRAALLHLIDMLSRWSAPGLAIIAGAGVYLAIAAGRAEPARAGVWAIMLILALWACRSMQRQFRAGASVASKPFRWRASYTACLTVLGVIFGAAPILLASAGSPVHLQFVIGALTIAAATVAALFHVGNMASALALVAPASVFLVAASLRLGDTGLLIGSAGLGVLAVFGCALLASFAMQRTMRIRPRTTFVRREAPVSGRSARSAAQSTAMFDAGSASAGRN